MITELEKRKTKSKRILYYSKKYLKRYWSYKQVGNTNLQAFLKAINVMGHACS